MNAAAPAQSATHSAGLPQPLPRREPGAPARLFGRFLLHVVLRPLTWLLRLFGVWPRLLGRSSQRMIRQFAGYTPAAHDILVCSYFKSGTNWTMQMALQIAWRGKAEFSHIHDLVPWLEIPDRIGFAVPVSDALWRCSPTRLRVIKTHLPIGRIAFNDEGRYIWVVRDPKDVFVSGYHFIRSIMLGPLMPSVDRWLDVYLSPDTFTGSWAEHLAAGWRLRDADNVLFLTFEEMRRNLPGTIRRIAALMDVQLSEREFAAVAQRASFDYMKAHGARFDPRGLSPPWVDARGAMLRRGRAGASAELLTPAQQARIDAYWQAQLAALGCDFPYAERFAGG